MKICHSLLAAVFLVALVASGQDWQDCKTDTSYSFKEVMGSVHRVTTSRMYTGGDEKTLMRSGDLVSVAILQTLNDSEMTSPETLEFVLWILREAFACPTRCVSVVGDRQPRVALLLLEHLHKKTRGKMQSSIDETTKFILDQSRAAETANSQ
jgi:hypothetical protein